MILEALVDMDQSTGIRSLVQDISRVLASNQGLSTQTTAYSLIAMSKYGLYQQNRDDITFAYRWAGNEKVLSSNRPMIMEEVDVANRIQGSLEIENLGSDTIYPRLIKTGIPMPGQEVSLSQGLTLSVTYKDSDGRRISLNNLEPGRDIKIQVQVTNTGYANYEELVLTHMVPSGWEIHNSRLSGSGGSGNFDYMDIRDDRVYTYFDLNKNRSKTFTLDANISYTGTYYLPMIICEAMYDPEIIAIEEGRWLNIQ